MQKKDNSKLKLTPLIIETEDIDVTNNEAVVKDEKALVTLLLEALPIM